MTKLTAGQIKGLAEDAGFSSAQAVVMTAIALAESGGDPQSHNEVPPDDSYGLWQINMYGNLGPARLKQFGLTSATQLFDPATNATAARQVFSGAGFKAWSTYSSGAYKLFQSKADSAMPISQATQGLGDDLAGLATAPGRAILGTGDILGNAADTFTTIANDVSKVGSWVSNPNNWLRVLYVAGGAAALLFAMQSLFKPVTDAAVKSVVKTASNAIPEAKAVTKTASVARSVTT